MLKLVLMVNMVSCGVVQDLSKVMGEIYLPGQAGFEDKRKVMNAACDEQPAIIVVPKNDQDVFVSIAAARKNNLELSIRSGGHSYTCTNIKEGGLHMDMRNFNKLEMVNTGKSPTGLALKLGPGQMWGDVLDFAPTSRYSYPHGQCRSVNVGGYLLGGGVNWLGTYNKYGYGAEYIIEMKVVLADGSIAWVDKDKTRIVFPNPRTVPHTPDNNLFFALRGAGSSYGVVVEFLYMINQSPEADPAVLLSWIETEQDLQAVHKAAKATNDYSITISQEFANEFWKKDVSQVVYELYPGIMTGLKVLNHKSGFPVPLTVTDIRATAGKKTDAAAAANYMRSQGVRMVFELGLTTNVFHTFAEYLYGNNMIEQQNWTPGKYYLSSLNFGGLEDTSSFNDIFFNDPSFGVKRADIEEFATHDCDYCFWMIHYRNRQRVTPIAQVSPISTNTEMDKPNTLDTNIVCMFIKPDADCPNLIKRVKTSIEKNLAGKSYSKYANFPSCSESDWASRYWRNYTQLLDIKQYWDPDNVFHHCQSVGSTDKSCCPKYEQTTQTQCVTTGGSHRSKPCVFPFTFMGQSYNSCVPSAVTGMPWCPTKLTSWGTVHTWSYCDMSTCN